MTQLAINTGIHNSLLLRRLVELDVHRRESSSFDVAQVLAQHISFVDAATFNELFGTHQSPRSFGATEANARQEYDKVRNAIEVAIRHSGDGAQTGARLSLPADHYPNANDSAGGFTPYRKYYQAHQQNIEVKVRTLRSKVRMIVAKCSPRLEQLTQLDAAWDGVLAELEASRLNNVIARLELRFNTLREEHRRFIELNQVPDSTSHWLTPSGWLSRFHKDLQTTLLAELDLRLLPLLGLIEATEADPSLNT